MSKLVRKTLRFSDEEYTKIEDIISEHNINFSEFARAAILKKKVNTKLTLKMINQVSKIGNNINQIAKRINTDNKLNILVELSDINDQLRELI